MKRLQPLGLLPSLDVAAQQSVLGGPLDLRGETLEPHGYLDKSVFGACATSKENVTSRTRPVREDALSSSLRADESSRGISLLRSLNSARR